MTKIYTFDAVSTMHGTVSIEADNFEEAKEKAERLNDADALVLNIAIGEGTTVLGTCDPEADADDGTHMLNTPRANAQENEDALEEITDDEEANDELGRDFLEGKAALGE